MTRRNESATTTNMLDENDKFGAVCILLHASEHLNGLYWDLEFSGAPRSAIDGTMAAIDLLNDTVVGMLR